MLIQNLDARDSWRWSGSILSHTLQIYCQWLMYNWAWLWWQESPHQQHHHSVARASFMLILTLATCSARLMAGALQPPSIAVFGATGLFPSHGGPAQTSQKWSFMIEISTQDGFFCWPSFVKTFARGKNYLSMHWCTPNHPKFISVGCVHSCRLCGEAFFRKSYWEIAELDNVWVAQATLSSTSHMVCRPIFNAKLDLPKDSLQSVPPIWRTFI